MSRTLFENSKAALAFAAVTIVGAVAMVGTSDNGGVLPAVVQKFSTQANGQAAPGQEGSGSEGGSPEAQPTPKSVFGDYTGTPQSGPLPSAPGSAGGNPMTAPVASTAVVSQNTGDGLSFGAGNDDPPPPPAPE